ncbi:MAG TPA: hypothetical protein VK638_12770, partial [Edaphobacter sp.]|nr:hypothetical protein [Edaphobacter sp.]
MLRVKYVLLSLHPLNQFLDPVKKGLVGGVGRYNTVMLDLLVDLNALLTHGAPFQSGDADLTTCGTPYKFRAIWFLAARVFEKGPLQKSKGTTP